MTRGLAALTALVLLLGAVAGSYAWWHRGPPQVEPVFADPAQTGDDCRDVRADDVRQASVCAGVWVGPARRTFVPQGVVVDGATAYLSGYREGRVGHRFCQLVVARARSGATEVFHRRLGATVQGRDVVCRHGGGLALGKEGLWLAETGRLWLLDPAALRAGNDPVLRVWRVRPPVRGSALALRQGRLALVGWAAARRHRAYWVPVAGLMADGVSAVGLDGGPGTVTPISQRRVPSRVQGAVWGPGGLWLARSSTYCGELVSPDGTTLPFFPGAEGIDFEDGRLWLVSESGSGVYQRKGGRPLLPTLLSVDPDRLEAADTGCGWE